MENKNNNINHIENENQLNIGLFGDLSKFNEFISQLINSYKIKYKEENIKNKIETINNLIFNSLEIYNNNIDTKINLIYDEKNYENFKVKNFNVNNYFYNINIDFHYFIVFNEDIMEEFIKKLIIKSESNLILFPFNEEIYKKYNITINSNNKNYDINNYLINQFIKINNILNYYNSFKKYSQQKSINNFFNYLNYFEKILDKNNIDIIHLFNLSEKYSYNTDYNDESIIYLQVLIYKKYFNCEFQINKLNEEEEVFNNLIRPVDLTYKPELDEKNKKDVIKCAFCYTEIDSKNKYLRYIKQDCCNKIYCLNCIRSRIYYKNVSNEKQYFCLCGTPMEEIIAKSIIEM